MTTSNSRPSVWWDFAFFSTISIVGILVLVMIAASGCSSYRAARWRQGFNQADKIVDRVENEKPISAYWDGFFSGLQLRMLDRQLKKAAEDLQKAIDKIKEK